MSRDAQELLLTELMRAKEPLAKRDRQLQHLPDFGLRKGCPASITWKTNLAQRRRLVARIGGTKVGR